MFFWTTKYRYDHILHGFTFKEDEMKVEEAFMKHDSLKSLYGDII